MSNLHKAASTLAREMNHTGVEPEDAKARFSAAYGEGVAALRIHWNAQYDCQGTPVHVWGATAEHDFITGYPDEIDIYMSREAAS